MSKEEIVTRTNKVWLGEDGVVRSTALSNAEETLTNAKETMAAIAKVSTGIKRPLLVDLTRAKSITREARTYYSGAEAAAHYKAVAIVAGSPVSRVIGNFYLGLNKTPTPTKLFGSEIEALAWLRGFLP